MEPQAFTFASSPFVPVAIGFLAWVPATSSLKLGWSGLVWFSQGQSRSQPNPGLMGFLDAGLHAAPHGHLSVDRIDVVQRLQQCGSFVYGGARGYCLLQLLFRDGRQPIYLRVSLDGWWYGPSNLESL